MAKPASSQHSFDNPECSPALRKPAQSSGKVSAHSSGKVSVHSSGKISGRSSAQISKNVSLALDEEAPEVTKPKPVPEPAPALDMNLKTISGLKEAMKKKYMEQFDAKAKQLEKKEEVAVANPLVAMDSLITEHTIQHAAEIVKMKKKLRKEDEVERTKLLSEERQLHESQTEIMALKHQKELKRLEELVAAERYAQKKVIEEMVEKHTQEIKDLRIEEKNQKIAATYETDAVNKELQTLYEDLRFKYAENKVSNEEMSENLKDAERQVKVLQTQLKSKCTIDDSILKQAIENERGLSEKKLAEYTKCLEAQKVECDSAITEMEGIYTQKVADQVKINEKLKQQNAGYKKQIQELREAQKPQTDAINTLTRKNTSLRKQVKEVKATIPKQIEKARNEERKASVKLATQVTRLEQQKSELLCELEESVGAQDINSLEVGILSALEKKDQQIVALRKMIAGEQEKNNKLELDCEKAKMELLKYP